MSHHHGNKDLGLVSDFGPAETFGHNTNDCEHLPVNPERLAGHVTGRSKPFLPTGISNHRDRMRAGRQVLFGRKITAKKWLNSQRLEIISGNQKAPGAFVAAVLAEVHRYKPV